MKQGGIVRDIVPAEYVDAHLVPVVGKIDLEKLKSHIPDRIIQISLIFKGMINCEDSSYSDEEALGSLADIHSMLVSLAKWEGLDMEELRDLDLIIQGKSTRILNRIMMLSRHLIQETKSSNRVMIIGQIYSLLLALTQAEGFSLKNLELMSESIQKQQGGFDHGFVLIDVLKPGKGIKETKSKVEES